MHAAGDLYIITIENKTGILYNEICGKAWFYLKIQTAVLQKNEEERRKSHGASGSAGKSF